MKALVLAVLLAAGAQPAAAQTKADAKAARCESYSRQLEANQKRARQGGSAKTMDRLNEERQRIQAAQSKAGC